MEPQNYNQKLRLCPPQKWGKTLPTFQTSVFQHFIHVEN